MNTAQYYGFMLTRWVKGKRYVFQKGYQSSKAGGKKIMIYREPWYVSRIVALSELFCALTLHYWCNGAFLNVDQWAEKKRTYFYIDSTPDEVERWCEFIGIEQPYWVGQEED